MFLSVNHFIYIKMIVYDLVKNITEFLGNTSYTYIDDEDITYIVPPKNATIILFADQPFEYMSNSSYPSGLDNKLVQFTMLSGLIGILACTWCVLCYKLSKSDPYDPVLNGNGNNENGYPEVFEFPEPFESPPGYISEDDV
jgi:hypothetical protein